MIELQGVSFGWPDRPPAFSGLSLRIAAGEKVVLLGPNGSGKSTLLKLLNGLVDPTTGRCLHGGEEITVQRLRERDRARRFRRECVLLFQHPEAMLFNATVRDEIAYGPRQLGLGDVDERVGRWSRELRLDTLLDKPPFSLSGGEKQKVALAAVLALDPKVLLLDEPSANLDPRTAGWLADYLLDTRATVVVSTHNLSMAAEFGERCLILDPGRALRYDGPIERALADVGLLETAQLAHRHRHRHGTGEHAHTHLHAWETPG